MAIRKDEASSLKLMDAETTASFNSTLLSRVKYVHTTVQVDGDSGGSAEIFTSAEEQFDETVVNNSLQSEGVISVGNKVVFFGAVNFIKAVKDGGTGAVTVRVTSR